MSDKIISIIIKKNGDIQINICQSNNNNENENKKESEKPTTEIIGDIKQELDWDNSLIQKST